MLEHTNQIKGKLREKVEAAVDDIKMSKFLATIRTDVPIELNWDELKIEQSDEDKLREIFTELEFKTLLNKFIKGNKEVQKPTIYSLIYLQKIRPLVQTNQKKPLLVAFQRRNTTINLLRMRQKRRTFVIIYLQSNISV